MISNFEIPWLEIIKLASKELEPVGKNCIVAWPFRCKVLDSYLLTTNNLMLIFDDELTKK